jgi:hypothetical protein
MVHSSSDGFMEYHGVDSDESGVVEVVGAVVAVVVPVVSAAAGGKGVLRSAGLGIKPLRYFSALRILAVVTIHRFQDGQFVPSNFWPSGRIGGVCVWEVICVYVQSVRLICLVLRLLVSSRKGGAHNLKYEVKLRVRHSMW